MMDQPNNERPPKRRRDGALPRPSVDDVMYFANIFFHRDDDMNQTAKRATRRAGTMEEDRDMREFFGCSARHVLQLWNLLVNTNYLPKDGTINHLLWTLLFCKIYPRRKALCTLCGGRSKNTIMKWVEAFLEGIANLESNVIVWENRHKNDRGADCLVTVDGVDCRCPNYGPVFSSHKFAKKGGLRYEVAVCIQTGDIVWINGPYPAGKYNDITIFRASIMSHLGVGERVEADDGYIGEAPQYIKCPKSFPNPEETLFMQQRVRNRQETANKRFKDWASLQQIFRHDILLHADVFRLVVIVTQLKINSGEPLFQCGYKDPPF